jgi:hypothetical protein
MTRKWQKLLGFLTFVTAILPFVLHYHLVLLVANEGNQEEQFWKQPTSVDAMQASTAAPWTLFYHIYFPPGNEEGYNHAAAIVKEQINMLGTKTASFVTKNGRIPLLYYAIIGEMSRNTTTLMEDLCRVNHLRCIELKHEPEGQEDLTLQALYNFCKAIPSQTVIYLHSKGSFHSEGPKFATQDIWRQRLTEAASHQLCLEGIRNGTCDTCSLLLQPLPGIHYPGNMWAASCEHVKRLLPPNTFAKDMDKVVQVFKKLRDTRQRLNTTFFAQMPHMMGRKRFAAEHWIGSHPNLKHPCDLSAGVTANLSEWLHPEEGSNSRGGRRLSLSSHDFQLGQWPSYPIDFEHWDYFRYGRRGHIVLETPALRLRDYFLLPGQLMKWYQLYQRAPSSESWIWTWFPDGDLWKNKLQTIGSNFWVHDTDDWLPPLVELVV